MGGDHPPGGRHLLAELVERHVHLGVREHRLGHEHGHLAAAVERPRGCCRGPPSARWRRTGRSRGRSGRTRRAACRRGAPRSARSRGWVRSREKPRDACAIGLLVVRLRIDLAYDGTDFHGWATQPGLRTVQGELSAALATALRTPTVDLVCAGRTDTGVHARGQVVHIDVDAEDAGRVDRSLGRAAARGPAAAGERHPRPRRAGTPRGGGRRTASTPASPRCGAGTPTGSRTSPAPSTRWRATTCSSGRGRSTWPP